MEDQAPNLSEDDKAVQTLLLEQIGIVQGCRGRKLEAVDTAIEEDGDNNNSKPRTRRRVGSAASQAAQSGYHLPVPTSSSFRATSGLPPWRNGKIRGIVMPPPTSAAPAPPGARATRALLPRPSPSTPRAERQSIYDDDLYDAYTSSEPRGPPARPDNIPRIPQNIAKYFLSHKTPTDFAECRTCFEQPRNLYPQTSMTVGPALSNTISTATAYCVHTNDLLSAYPRRPTKPLYSPYLCSTGSHHPTGTKHQQQLKPGQ